MIGWLRSSVFSISTDEASFAKRGFNAKDETRRSHLEHCATAFVDGYNAAIRFTDSDELVDRLSLIDDASRGFAYEGAGMGFALRDGLNPVRSRRSVSRFDRFLAGCGSNHLYMAHVGAGWAAARLPWVRRSLSTYLNRFDSLLRWLVLDGYGFHQGFFNPARFVEKMEQPSELSGYGLRAFDQGLGRCLWFVCGGNVEALIDTVARMDAYRRDDLYSGASLAITYAGGATDEDAASLLKHAYLYRGSIGQGAAFAAKARVKAGNVTEHTETACRILCRSSVEDAAKITDDCLVELNPTAETPAYEVWRRRIATAIESL